MFTTQLNSEDELRSFIDEFMMQHAISINEVCDGTGINRIRFWRWRNNKPGAILSFGDFLQLMAFFQVKVEAQIDHSIHNT